VTLPVLYIRVRTDPKNHKNHEIILTNTQTKEAAVIRTLTGVSRREAVEYATILANTDAMELGKMFDAAVLGKKKE
jgi:hypothetical protein